MEAGASGDIAIGILRRNGTITIPVYLWLNAAWVDLQTLTVGQWNTYVNARLVATANPNGQLNVNNPDGSVTLVGQKVDGLTVSKDQF